MRASWFFRELERRERAWEKERASLIATICLLAEKPVAPSEMDEWQAAQAAERAAERAQREEEDDDLVDYDQLPD